jgi:NADH-quinone oxidoreductase subunit J
MEAILGNQVMFILFSAMIVMFSILTVTSRRILRAATFLLFVLLSTAGLYFMLNYQFLAAVQITLYAGGIVVLIIFSILLTSHIDHKFDKVPAQKLIMGVIAAGSGIALSLITLLTYNFVPANQEPISADMNTIGKSLLNYGDHGFVLPFEVISVLLLAAIVAAVVIAKRKKV